VRAAVTDLIKALSIKCFDADESVFAKLVPLFMNGVVKDWSRNFTTREALLGTEKHIQMDDT
jgi:hypothetical protein